MEWAKWVLERKTNTVPASNLQKLLKKFCAWKKEKKEVFVIWTVYHCCVSSLGHLKYIFKKF